jgi:PAS domain-containing protein
MYKLTVVSGPNRGTSYVVNEGMTSIGRQTGNTIVLSSHKISKKHCTLVVSNEDITVEDAGSSNGTFVNGVMTKQKKIQPGDRISVGEFVLELVKPAIRAPRAAPAVQLGNVVQLPVRAGTPAAAGLGVGMGPGASAPGAGINLGTSATGPQVMPTDLKGKAIWYFENQFMPLFYGMMLKTEWRVIAVGMLGSFVLANLLISVYPLIQSSRGMVVKETGKRALFMAKQITEKNSVHIASKAETKTEIGSIEREDGARVALLVDLDLRVLAPGVKLGQYLTNGDEARFASEAAAAFRKGRETPFVRELNDTTIAAIDPVKVVHPQLGKNVTAAMSVVSLDTSLATPDVGEMGVVYSETLIITGFFAGLLLLVLYRLTLKPFQVLNDDIDKVLKGDMSQVTHEFKMSEMNALWDIINSALQRVPKGGGGSADGAAGGLASGPAVDEYAGPVRMIGNLVKFGLLICDQDRKIVYMNAMMEEITGIRSDNAIGNDIPTVARDQAFGAFSNDVFDRAPVGGEGVSEDFDFSGVSFKMYAGSFGAPGATARCFVLLAVRNEG